METYRGELDIMHPAFPANSSAALTKIDGPLKDVKDIVYSAEDDKAIEQRVREILSTTWHSLGTCKMRERERSGVVDSKLNVYGLQGLKLADLSVPPENVGANTGGTAFVTGEKAADIMIQELGLLRN